jgi:hypothetical protein
MKFVMSVTVFIVCRGLVLSGMNLRLSYANHELLYTSSLAVKKWKELVNLFPIVASLHEA